MKPFLPILSLLFLSPLLFAQIPSNDENWQLQISEEFDTEEEFDSQFIRGWGGLNSLMHGITGNNGCTPELQYYKTQNVVLNNGKLELIVKEEQLHGKMVDYGPNEDPFDTVYCDGITNYRAFDYTSGSIRSLNQLYYGYYEVNCKLPLGKGFWPAFWLYAGVDCGHGHEIDVLEPTGAQMEFALEYGANNHGFRYISLLDTCVEKPGYSNIPTNRMDLNFYSYSCEWSPETINYYYNNSSQPASQYKGPFVPRYPAWVFMNVAVDPFNPPNSSTAFPSKMEIDYFRYYTLKMACDVTIIESNFDFVTHDYSVKKLYQLSNSSVNVGEQHTLRATDYIQLEGDFTVPLGSELALIPTKCYD